MNIPKLSINSLSLFRVVRFLGNKQYASNMSTICSTCSSLFSNKNVMVNKKHYESYIPIRGFKFLDDPKELVKPEVSNLNQIYMLCIL